MSACAASLPPAPHVLWSDISFARRADGCRVVLGVGTTGIVFRASLRGEPVAVKCVHSPSRAALRALLAEARVAWTVRTAGVAGALGFALDGDGAGGAREAAVVLELVDGGTSLDAWARGGCATPSLLARVRALADVVSALRTLHARGIAHGDLSANNVLVDGRARARVIDFGSAHAFGDGGVAWGGAATIARSAATPAYEDPLAGSRECGGCAVGDIFSFSILAWETLCLFDAWAAVPGGDVASLRAHIARGGRPDAGALPRALGEELCAAIEAAWSPLAAARPTAAELAAIFSDAVDALAMHDTPARGPLQALDTNVLGGDDGDANDGGGGTALCGDVSEVGSLAVSGVFLSGSPTRVIDAHGERTPHERQRRGRADVRAHDGANSSFSNMSRSTTTAPTPSRAASSADVASDERTVYECDEASVARDEPSAIRRLTSAQTMEVVPMWLAPHPSPPPTPRAIMSPVLASHDAYATALLRAINSAAKL
jgi:serine/threonine protein kinase